ncbi:Spore germination protein [Paenibacillus jilunlii]|uniref:Spore germination protein n=1 Tax=Paenibacillus jilunlii TaxID=682956 RepID=A0A1G9KIM5_9BACL|nr:GerAB/ArcD/ProY family transporter [Paenibacillus jilunlii]KWX69927.1 hypothetical protein AML91_29665 [Paenibacillus jilunlii]SDL49347.1 Spore germination protein [Paenibacillus jilunlii]
MDRTWQITLMYFFIHLGLIFFLYPGDVISSTNDGHWLPVIIGFMVHLAAITVYMKGLSFIGRRDIISLYLEAGKGWPLLLLLPVTVYFLLIIIITLRYCAEMMTIVFLSNTPLWAIMLLFLLIAAFIAIKGIGTLLRTGVLTGMLCLPVILLFTAASFQNVDWRYIFPLADGFAFFTDSDFYQSFFAFAGGFLFLGFLQPYFTYRKKNIFIAALVLLPFFLFSVYIPVLTFGQATASTFHFPFIAALDSINLSWLMFDRITIFFFLCLISFTMLFLTMVLWSTIRVISRCIPVIKPSYLTFALPVLIFIACMAIPNWEDVKLLFEWNSYLRFYVVITIPLSTYFFGKRLQRKVDCHAAD